MRPTNKSRSRNKNNNRNRSVGNVLNRVFDSAGPEGKVRGTPQQIIDKYQGLTRDAQLSGDRVAAENFQQHAEHYLRMLNDAMREQAERQAAEAQRRQNQPQQSDTQPAETAAQPQDQVERSQPRESAPQPDVTDTRAPEPSHIIETETTSDLVETPEANGTKAPAPRKPRGRTRRPAAAKDAEAEAAAGPIQSGAPIQ